jgi:hypothetical protein
MSIGEPTVNKDLSLISLVPKWSGLDSGVTLEEFFNSIEASAKIGRWQENDQREIAVMRLADSVKLFYQGYTKLHEEGTKWQAFKNAFSRPYKDTYRPIPFYKTTNGEARTKREPTGVRGSL